MTRADQGRRGDSAPPAAAAGVKEPRAETDWRDPRGRRVAHRSNPRRLEQNVDAHQQQVGAHERPHERGIDIREHPGSKHRAENASQAQLAHQPPVDIAVIDVRSGRGAGGENLGGVHQRTRVRGRHPDRQHRRRGDDAERHAERAVDHLREETDDKQQEKLGRHRVSPLKMTAPGVIRPRPAKSTANRRFGCRARKGLIRERLRGSSSHPFRRS